ncbi:MAG: beta-lactamase family protein [Clostridia bacterium]|nr:beta-lactamase family protein [Clostridia bacterium]
MKQQIIERFPGIGCAWADAGGRESAAYHGFADLENQIPVDEETIFPACSISKCVTAICIMKLQERKQLDVDLPVNRYLRQWKLLTSDGHESDASIRSILSHTAGIVDGEDSFCGLRMGEPEISLMDILEGRTSCNNRPVRTEKPQGTAFEYSDAGYCVLQQLVQEAAQKAFADAAREMLFDPLGLSGTFFVSSAGIARYGNRMATGYDDRGLPIPGRFPPVPDSAASGLWSTPKELLVIAREFVKALHGESAFLQAASAREMARPVKGFPWTGLGVFIGGKDILVTQGWGENGQCMMKMNSRTREISVVMANRNPGADQAESGIEWLVDRAFTIMR